MKGMRERVLCCLGLIVNIKAVRVSFIWELTGLRWGRNPGPGIK